MEVDDALYHAVHGYKPDPEHLARRMKLAYSSLLNMANPNSDVGWPLGRFIQVMDLTFDYGPLQALCRRFNGVFVPLPTAVGDSEAVMAQLATVGKEFGDVCASLQRALADGRVSPKELKNFRTQVHENIRVLHELDTLVVKHAEAQPLFRPR